MAVEDIGARLVLSGRTEFVADMDAATTSVDAFRASVVEAGAALEGLEAKAAGMRDVTAETAAAGAAQRDVALETDAAAAASTRRAKAASAEKDAVGQATKAAENHKSSLENLASNSIIKGTALFGVGALAATAYESIKQYTKFNQAVTQAAVDAGLPAKDLGKVSKSLLQDTRETGVAAIDMANTFYRVQSAMSGTHMSLKGILQMTKDAAKLDVLFNVAPGTSTEQTGRILGALMNAKLGGATNPDQAMALINAAVGRGDIRGADMISALGKMLPAAKAMGANAPDMLAWVDMLTKQGMAGSQAGTLIAHSVQQLAHPSEQGQKAEQMLGITPSGKGSLQDMLQTQGIPATVKYLTDSMKKFNPTSYYPKFSTNAPGQESALAQLTAWGITDPATQQAFLAGTMNKDQTKGLQNALLSKIFGGAKSAMPMLALTANESGFSDLVKSINQGATPQALAESMRLAMNTPGRQMRIAEQNVAVTGMQIGRDLTPAATEAFRIFGDIAKYLGSHTSELEGLLAALTAFVGTAVAIEAVSKIHKIAQDASQLWSTTSNIINKLTGGALGTAAQAAPTAEFAGAVTEFTAAVTEFSGASGVGALTKDLPALGAVAGGEASAGALTAEEAGILGLGGKGALSKTAASDLEKLLAGGGGAAGAEGALTTAGGLAASIPASIIAAFAVGVALFESHTGVNANIPKGYGIGPDGKTLVKLPKGKKLTPEQERYDEWAKIHQLGPFSPTAKRPPPGPFDTPTQLTGALATHVTSTLGALNKSQIYNMVTAHGTRGFHQGEEGPPLSPWMKGQISGQESKAAGSAIKDASKQLKTAGEDHTKAAELLFTAGTKHGEAAEKLKTEGNKMEAAAKAHQQAAKDITAAAQKVALAAQQLASTPIQATVSQIAVGQAAAAYHANIISKS